MESYTKRGYYKADILLFPLIAFQDKLDQVINRCLNNGTSAGGEPGSAFHWSERSATPLTHTQNTDTTHSLYRSAPCVAYDLPGLVQYKYPIYPWCWRRKNLRDELIRVV